jgi:hypothetical protein
MKRLYKYHPLILSLGIILLCLFLSNSVAGDELVITTYQVTSSSLYETTPTLGNDGTSDLVVYTSRELLPSGSFDQGDIWYQRLVDGAPSGVPVQVTSDLTEDQLNDVSGDYIVYTAYDSLDTMSGSIMLYQISTGILQPIGYALVMQEPRIHGNNVVWVQGSVAASEVMIYELDWLGTPQTAQPITGPVPACYDVQIGDRYVVWVERDGDYDIGLYDLWENRRLRLTDSLGIIERAPSTYGDWIVWMSQDFGVTGKRIEAVNLETGDYRLVVDDGSNARLPSINGDLITYESDINGNFDIFVYCISSGETFTVTTGTSDQYLNDVFGNLVAYVDSSAAGNEDIYVSKLDFISCYPDLPAPELIVTGKEDYVGSDGREYTKYLFSITNWSAFPDELFVAAPDLPPCGENPNASRTWVDIYNQNDTYLYGFCALSASKQLTGLWFAVLKGQAPPEYVYITLTDRKCDITYKSNLASIPQWEKIVQVLNQALKTINRLELNVFSNPKMQTALTNKINAVLELIKQGFYQEALDKLVHDILIKTDGCANIGVPDRNDWIRDCEAQNLVYPLIIKAIELLRDLI